MAHFQLIRIDVLMYIHRKEDSFLWNTRAQRDRWEVSVPKGIIMKMRIHKNRELLSKGGGKAKFRASNQDNRKKPSFSMSVYGNRFNDVEQCTFHFK